MSLYAWPLLGLGLALTGYVTVKAKQDIEQDGIRQFAITADQVTLKIEERLKSYALILRGGAGLFAGSGTVDRAEWKAYVEKLRAEDSVPGVQGIGFTQSISPEQLADHVAAIRNEGFPDYRVHPPGEREIYTSIIYLEPFNERNQRAFGFDMFSEPVRRAAMALARDSGAPALSGRVRLVQETDTDIQAGTLMYVPVYRNGVSVETPEQRQRALVGWAYSPYRMNDMMEGILTDWGMHEGKFVDLHIFDVVEADNRNLLFDSHPDNPSDSMSPFHVQRTIDFGGRRWALEFTPVNGVTAISYFPAWATAVVGALLSALLAGLMMALGSTQSRAREIATKLTSELRQGEAALANRQALFSAVFDHAAIGLALVSPTGQFVNINSKFCTILGYARNEMLAPGFNFQKITLPEDLPRDLAQVERLLTGEADSYTLQKRYIHKDGHLVWAELNVRLVRDGTGHPDYFISSITDITARKEVEALQIEAKQTAEIALARLKEAEEIVCMGHWVIDLDSGRLEWSEQTYRMFGVSIGTPVHLDMFSQIVHPDDRPSLAAAWTAAVASRGHYEIDHRIVVAGDIRWVRERADVSRIRDCKVVGTVQDITERKLTEEDRKATEEKLKRLFELSPLGIALTDIQGHYVEFNEAFRAMTGYPADELMALDYWTLTPERYKEAEDRQLRLLAETGRYGPYEKEYRQKDGTCIPLNLNGVLITGVDGQSYIWSIVEDITARKQAQGALIEAKQAAEAANLALQESEAGFRLMFDDAPDAYLILDLQDIRILASNRAAEHMLRGTREQIVGSDILTLCPPLQPDGQTSLEATSGKVASVLQTGHQRFEFMLRRLDGEDFWAEANVSPGTYQGRPVLFGVWRELGEIIAAKQAAEAANIAKSRFLATMSHEIRTPMNGILGMAQLLLGASMSEAERRDCARTILNSGQTLLTLLNDILDLSKVEAGKLSLEMAVVDPQQILHETLALFSDNARAKGLRLNADWAGPDFSRYRSDPHRLRQMLSNLVNNAIKFTAQGEIHLSATELDGADGTSLLEFAVTDTGIGIPEDQRTWLFEPFVQVDSSTTRQFGGTGLGLSIVRSLAKAMGGEVGAESKPGSGSRFWFRVRAERLSAATDSRQVDRSGNASPTEEIYPRLSGRVLIVEDNPTNQLVLNTLLPKIGIQTVLAENGQEAVDLVVAGGAEVDAILMDLQMPIMDGFAATERIRAWEKANERPTIPIIALTADAFPEDREHCLRVGMDDFIAKPIMIDDLLRSLGRFLEGVATPLAVTPASEPTTRTLDGPGFIAMAEALLPLLAQGKFEVIDRFVDLETLAAQTPEAAALREIREVLDAFHFDRAQEALTLLLNQLAAKDNNP